MQMASDPYGLDLVYRVGPARVFLLMSVERKGVMGDASRENN